MFLFLHDVFFCLTYSFGFSVPASPKNGDRWFTENQRAKNERCSSRRAQITSSSKSTIGSACGNMGRGARKTSLNVSPIRPSHRCGSMITSSSPALPDADGFEGALNGSAGFQIGHSYFCTCPGIIDEKSWFNKVVASEIKPLPEEIWFDDPDKVKRLTDSMFVQ